MREVIVQVKLIQDYGDQKSGSVIKVSSRKARNLLAAGYAAEVATTSRASNNMVTKG